MSAKTAAEFKVLPFKVLEDGTIDLNPSEAPFNGQAVLIQTYMGVCEASWDEHPGEEPDDTKWMWTCCEGMMYLELEDAVGWCPLPQLLPTQLPTATKIK